MAPDDHNNTDSTGYECIFNNEPIIYVNIPAVYYEEPHQPKEKLKPIWLKGRKNKRDNFKLK